MEPIDLTEPTAQYAGEIWQLRQEILACDAQNEDRFAGCLSLDACSSAEEWIRLCRLRRDGATCRMAGVEVPSHTFLAVRRRDGRLVGVIDLRHHIDHPILGTWGGHCGYTVRPRERGQGYAREMLRLNLLEARALGLERLLVTCDERNAASERTILANGGVYECTIAVGDDRIRRYWITVPSGL